MRPAFTVAFVCHSELPLLRKTVPNNLDALCRGTGESYETVLVIDGVEHVDHEPIVRAALDWGIDEVRLRSRRRHCVGGDPSNNGHAHLLNEKAQWMVVMEGDVAVFRVEPEADLLGAIRQRFEAAPGLALATRVDDHSCWAWPLAEVGPPLAPGVLSVNRVASHFLVFDTNWAGRRMREAGGVLSQRFHDTGDSWFNYEDWLSRLFAQPAGPGIGYLDDLPMRVFHCDRKVTPGSVFYTKDLAVKLAEFDLRQRELDQ